MALEQEMETKDPSDRVRQRTDDYHNSQDRTDQCALPPWDTRTSTSRRCTKTSRLTATTEKHIRIISTDFNAQLGLGIDSERDNPTREVLG